MESPVRDAEIVPPLDGFVRHAGDVLTLFRFAAVPPFVGLVLYAPHSRLAGWSAVALFAAVATSDFLDGRLARSAGAASERGRVLDHGADIVFLLSALSSYVAMRLLPWWVPAAIAASFGFYVYDSWRRHGSHRPVASSGLRPSRVGHLGGVFNYTLVGVLVCNESAAIGLLSAENMTVLYLLVPCYSAAAILERIRLARSRRVTSRPESN
jgi:phosphatidylglycerophosphate synthase